MFVTKEDRGDVRQLAWGFRRNWYEVASVWVLDMKTGVRAWHRQGQADFPGF